jgi:hypothetical protein
MENENSTDQQEKRLIPKNLLKRLFGLYEIIAVMLTVLAIIGVAITDFSPGGSHFYWLVMVPVFAVACLTLERKREGARERNWSTIFRSQFLLWLGLLVAVQVVYMLLHSGRLNNENTGLIILLLLALTTFFAGVRLDWRLLIIGFILGLALIGAAYLETFFWLFFLLAAAVIAAFLLYKHFTGD